MTTIAATEARRALFHLLRDAVDKHEVIRIQHRQGGAVLLSEEDYDSLLETLELLAIPGFRASMRRSVRQMKAGQTLPLEEVLGDET